jgi:hypothetical protein
MRGTKGIRVVCILAALALPITIAADAASAAPGTSMAAKKTCKKKHSAKKKCKKNRKSNATRSPVIRATLRWGNGGADNVDMDLFVFDAEGNIAGDGSDAIPLSSITSDVSGPAGFETFTDSLFSSQAARDLSFGVCYSAGLPARTDFNLTYVTADGVIHGDSQSPDTTTRFDYPGGAPIPAGFCSR